MLNRTLSLVVCLGIVAGAALAQTATPTAAGTSYVVEISNTNSSGQLQGFPSNTSTFGTPSFSAIGPASTTQVIAKPDGTKYYVIGSSVVDDFTPGFGTSAPVNGLQGTLNPPVSGCSTCPPTQTVLSPDGRYLLIPSSIGSGAGAVYVLNTLTDAVVDTQTISGSVVGIVVSRDSKTAWILGASSQTFITTINLTSLQQSGAPIILKDPVTNVSLGGGATAFTMSPLGLLYVSASDSILEINPSTLQTAQPTITQIGVNGTAGPLSFLSDGSMAYFPNETPNIVGQSILSVAIPSHTVKSWPPFAAGQQLQLYDQIVVASPTRIFAHTAGNTTLWDVAPDLSTVTVSGLNSVLPASSVFSIAASNEIPNSQYFYALVGVGSEASIYRVLLSTNTVDSQASTLGPGTLQFVIVPPESSPTTVTQFNATQPNLTAGATALPLIGQILDPVGRPMYNVPVTFTGDSSLIFTNVTPVSNKDGWVQATVTLGTAAEPPGQYPVTLTVGTGAGAITATYALTIPGIGVGPVTPGGPNQMTIISGNGQLCEYQLSCLGPPLTVQELDTKGNPIVNDAVVFTVTGPAIGAVTASATTDKNGLAQATFYTGVIQSNIGFQGTTVTAVGTYGAVTFNETVFQLDNNGQGYPSRSFTTPTSDATITVGAGDVIPALFVATVFNHAFSTNQATTQTAGAWVGGPEIPDIAINILPTALDASGDSVAPGYCRGYPLTSETGNALGTVSCDFVASCAVELGYQNVTVDLGNQLDKSYQMYFTPGHTQTLMLTSGNNQTGRAGSALTLPLTATVGDNCGNPASGVTVTWKVTQGSATFTGGNTTTTTTSNQAGTVSTHLTLGSVPGPVTVTATIGQTNSVSFTETVQAVVGTLTLVSGSGQTALVNTAFASPVVFQIKDTTGNPVQNLTVNFSLAGGSATLGSTSATTNAQGQVSLTVTAGGTAGPVTVTATYSTFSASASLTVIVAGPQISASSFTNWASGQAGLVPCGLGIATGPGLATGITGLVNGTNLGIGPWPYTLGGVSITINGSPVPIAAVSNQNGVQQVYFQTPCEIVTGSPATVVVQVGSASTQVTGVTVYPAQPGIFTYAGPGGTAYAEVVDSNGSYITPSNLAAAGNTYYLIATGLGQTTPAAITNSVGTGSQTIPASSVILAINNQGVPVNSVQYQQGERGLYLISFTIPIGFSTGTNMPLTLGLIGNAQTFYDLSSVALPGIH